jgi:Tfp pilus assembly protein PilF
VLGPYQTADVQIAMGRSLEKQGGLEEARAAYLEALKHDPDRTDACERLTVVASRLGKTEEAEKWCRKAQEGKPTPDLHCNLGYHLYLQGRNEEAESRLRQALADNPDHLRAHNNLGLVLARTGRDEEALTEFRKAGCTVAEAHNNLGFALTLKGDWPTARKQYELALSADPSFARAKEGLRRLTALEVRAAGAVPAREPGAATTATPLQPFGGVSLGPPTPTVAAKVQP